MSRSQKITCDRCGATAVEPDRVLLLPDGWKLINTPTASWDLCPTCFEELDEWLRVEQP